MRETKAERARRAAHAAERAHVIAALGWEAEGRTPDDKYPSTTAELSAVLAKRTAAPAVQ